MIAIQAKPLEGFAFSVLRAMGADADVAADVARHLVHANMSGHDSHGILRIPQYVGEADAEELVPASRPELISEGPVTALFDGHRGFGHFACSTALDWCRGAAQRSGLAAAAVRHTMHIGRLGDYAERAAADGLVAIVTVGQAGPGSGIVAPHGGAQRFLGTNPWAIAVPAEGRPPVLFDAATSTIAEGKNRMAMAKGAQLAPGILRDRDGNPSTNPADLYEGGALGVVGGELGGHKGYGLSLAAALVGGLAMIGDPDPTTAGTSRPPPDWVDRIAGAFMIVIDPGRFGDPGAYARAVAGVAGAATRVQPAPGYEEVLVPGDPELRSRAARATEGIPIPDPTWEQLSEIGARFGVALPAP